MATRTLFVSGWAETIFFGATGVSLREIATALVTDGFDVFEDEDFEDEGLVIAAIGWADFLTGFCMLLAGTLFGVAFAAGFLATLTDDGRALEAGFNPGFAAGFETDVFAFETAGLAFLAVLPVLAGGTLVTIFLTAGTDFLPFDAGAAAREDTDRFGAAFFLTMGIAKILEVLPLQSMRNRR